MLPWMAWHGMIPPLAMQELPTSSMHAWRRPLHVAQVAIASHFGRPQPNKQSWAEMRASPHSLAVVASALASRLGTEARWAGMAPDCVGPEAEAWVGRLLPGQACLLENTRFHAGDVDNDPAFAKALAALCDVFVCDAFGVMHRDQASVTVGAPSFTLTHHDMPRPPSARPLLLLVPLP